MINAPEKQERIIEPGRTSARYFTEIWNHRELFYFLAWRDLLVRYKQTIAGVAWTILRPLITIVAFTFVFGKLAGLPSHGIPYPVLVFCALLPWSLFSTGLSHSSDSLVANSHLITKIYFPRIIIPAASIIVILVDFMISFCLLILVMAFFRFVPGWRILFLPFFLIAVIMLSLGIGFWLASLNVKYRDLRYLIPFLVQVGLYISPIGFTSQIVPESWRSLYSINPMVGVIDGFRWSLLPDQPLYLPGVALSIGLVLIFFWTGLRYFKKVEGSFPDFL